MGSAVALLTTTMELTEWDPAGLFEKSPSKVGVVGSETEDGEGEG